jgi:sporulation protein YlmC with PRC-barrel domain
MTREVHLELLLGRPVRARNGRRIGRIEEVRAGEKENVDEFLVGELALMERLAALGLFEPKNAKKRGYRVRWDQLDWSDPYRPRINCPVEELEGL